LFVSYNINDKFLDQSFSMNEVSSFVLSYRGGSFQICIETSVNSFQFHIIGVSVGGLKCL